MKITFELDIAVISDRYLEDLRSLNAIAQNLRYADTKYSIATVKGENEWRDRCLAVMKAIEAFYLTDEILPEYTVEDWAKDVLNLRSFVGATVPGNDPLSCVLTGTGLLWGSKRERGGNFTALRRAFGKAKGKDGWNLVRRDLRAGDTWQMEIRLEKPKGA